MMLNKGIESDLLKGVDHAALETWLANYCKANPLDNLSSASIALQKALLDRMNQAQFAKRTSFSHSTMSNDPRVRPWIVNGEHVIDVTPQVSNPKSVFLLGEHGACMFLQLCPRFMRRIRLSCPNTGASGPTRSGVRRVRAADEASVSVAATPVTEPSFTRRQHPLDVIGWSGGRSSQPL